MGIIGMGNECFLYVNGISVSKPIWLHDTVCLSPTKSAIKWQEVMSLFENDIEAMKYIFMLDAKYKTKIPEWALWDLYDKELLEELKKGGK